MTFTAANFRQLLPDSTANIVGKLASGDASDTPKTRMYQLYTVFQTKNLAIANRSRVGCGAHTE